MDLGGTVVTILKVTFVIGLSLTFMVAINTLINLLVMAVSTSVVGEIMGILSNSLPFNASLVFGGAMTACNAVLSFMIARKIWDLTTNRVTI